ncbi:MarR family winged helix-turn-helix transcriptional regulator [Portibacter marinus]|uniref:MarR family winged helix-turn-helix transcriptional regulator n=1 Tax=Portibacter marinus TaxID=2898660 RepID=UPI001F44374D|nr:MarR family transcriptional regulator [Portibacter marinus]
MIGLPTDTIFYKIEKAIKSYRKFAQKQIQNAVPGITLDQALVLMIIKNKPDLTQMDIGQLFFKDYASITRMIDSMIKKDYITKTTDQNDRRRSNICVTDMGNEVLKMVLPIIERNRALILEGLSDREIEDAGATLTKMVTNCEEKVVELAS